MLAAVVKRPGELVIEQVEKPKPGPGQFLIKVLASSICNATDNHILEGIFDGNHDRYPQVLGHEVCGEVVELVSYTHLDVYKRQPVRGPEIWKELAFLPWRLSVFE